jgi:dethiobiotin synthetase
VPIQQNEDGTILTCEDLANELGAPVVIAARRTLGTINHTLLTCRTSLQSPAHFAGIVWCDAVPVEENDVAAQGSPEVVEDMTGLLRWGNVPYLPSLEHRVLVDAAEQYVSWPL